MTHLKTLGLRLAVAGIGTGSVGLFTLGRRRKLTASDIRAMDDKSFDKHVRSIGLKPQVQDALARLNRGSR